MKRIKAKLGSKKRCTLQSDASSVSCTFRIHGSPGLLRSAYQPKGKSANSLRLRSSSIG